MDQMSDAELARMLQLQFDSEAANIIADGPPVAQQNERQSTASSSASAAGSSTMGIVDPRWELIDPHPDIRALFVQFNDQFFWGRLEGVEVRWSPRMTLCAGLCCYEGYGGLCSVRLSQPLLKLRPRKDLVETLLHEMIHAYLFVTQNNKDHDGHGPEFCKHMSRINTATGTHISIYHTFHDEVDLYRQHWWRCDGPCRQRKPYFGYVKRSMNRAPSHRDTWWGEHQRSCGGTFTKIKEPEGYGQKKGAKKGDKKGEEVSTDIEEKPGKQGEDIRNFIAFSGKGQTLGGGKTSSSSGNLYSASTSSSTGKITNTAKTTPPSGSPRKSNSDRKDISSFFDKKKAPGNTSSSQAAKSVADGERNPSHVVPHKKPRFTPVVATASGHIVSGTTNSSATKSSSASKVGSLNSVGRDVVGIPNKKPRFTPVVATASGQIVRGPLSSSSSGESSSRRIPTLERDSDKPRFAPIVSSVGKKNSVPASDRSGIGSSPTDAFVSRKVSDGFKTTSPPSSSSSIPKNGQLRKGSSGSGRLQTGETVLSSSGASLSERSRNKRARLLDLQAEFDSDSEDESEAPRSAKYPRYSVNGDESDDDSLIVVGISNRVSSGSNKENSPEHRHQASDSDDIYITGFRPAATDEDDVVASVTGNRGRVNTGIWKDLPHLASSTGSGSQEPGGRRFGRVPPPLYGKSGKNVKGRSRVGDAPPSSSFCEHPWQTAARESGKKASPSVARVTDADDIISMGADIVGGKRCGSGSGSGGGQDVVCPTEGPKKVPCPVCNLQIEEKKINVHLDTCLTYNCDALFSP